MTPAQLERIAKAVSADLAERGYAVTIEEARALVRLAGAHMAITSANPKLRAEGFAYLDGLAK